MIHRLRLTLVALALGAGFLLSGATAAADDGATNTCTTRGGKPSCTILRPLTPPARIAPLNAPECIVAVGGLGSDNSDKTFDELLRGFKDDPIYRIHRFGAEQAERFPYDTYGSIDESGRTLLGFVRSLSGQCRAIHIVAHSMGGDVADRAFSLGLSSADGVVTYLPIATPHNGALLADILIAADDVSDEGNEALRAIARTLRRAPIVGSAVHDVTSEAVRELADRTPPRPPRGVVELRQRLANDEIALLPDNWDWRFESRDRLPDLHGTDGLVGDLLNPISIATNTQQVIGDVVSVGTSVAQRGLNTVAEIEGHGGSLLNDAIRSTTEFVIRHVALPPDDRDTKEKLLAFALSIGVMIFMVVKASELADVLLKGVLLGSWITAPLHAVLPGRETWWTKSFPNLLEKTIVPQAEDRILPETERAALPYVKGVVTRLRNEVDHLGTDAEERGDEGRARGTRVDPRVALVRAVLDRAADALKHL